MSNYLKKEALKLMEKDRKIKYCKKCNNKTKHIIRGFGTPGGLCGNARWECLECNNL